MAGNIIPAIATTNAIVAGMIVVEVIRMIRGGGALDLRAAYTNPTPIASRLVSSSKSNPPNPKCFVCSSGEREVHVTVNLEAMKLSTFEEQVLKKGLSLVEPDVMDVGSNNIIIASDGEVDTSKTLKSVGVKNGSRLACDDFKQDFNVTIQVFHDATHDAVQFEIKETGEVKDESMTEEASEEPAPTIQNETGLIKESMEVDEPTTDLKKRKRSFHETTNGDEQENGDVKRSRVEV